MLDSESFARDSPNIEMKKSSKPAHSLVPARDWWNRILVLGIAGIVFLTLYPFGFTFHIKLPGSASPLFLQSGMKSVGIFDDFLNILLFVPFGFGVAARVRRRGMSRRGAFILALAAGAMLSYGIEFLQNYLPSRDAGWHDVITNTAGSVAGFALFELLGKAVLSLLAKTEDTLGRWLTPWRAVSLLPVYFIIWFAASAYLQEGTLPINWDPNCSLAVGNAAAGRPGSGWKGEVERLEFWDQTIPDDLARKLTAGDRAATDLSGFVAAYDFSGAAPFRDEKGYIPDLTWKSSSGPATNLTAIVLDGKSWLSSAGPVSGLIGNIRKTKRFSVHLVCTPAYGEGTDGRIVTISRASGLNDLDLRQDDANLVFWFRNPISASHASLAWYIPNTFVPNQKRDILFSYDGANLSLYVNGQKEGRKYELGPGTNLARVLRRVKPSELVAYKYVYYALLFFSGGILLGIVCRNMDLGKMASYVRVGAALLLPPFLLEIILVHVSGRSPSPGDIALGFFLAVGGCFWINIK